MAENYKLIRDLEELEAFVDWLPTLLEGECYYISLFARKKYTPNSILKADKSQLKRFTCNKKELIIPKIRQLECVYGSYEFDNQPVPQESLCLYITPNPRSYEVATKKSLIKFADLITRKYNGYNPHQEVLSNIQSSYSRKIYFDIDFDNVDFEQTVVEISKFINPSCLTYVKTRGGFHLLVELEKIEQQYVKNWYQNITKLNGADIRGDNLLPIPGTYQGGFTPILIPQTVLCLCGSIASRRISDMEHSFWIEDRENGEKYFHTITVKVPNYKCDKCGDAFRNWESTEILEKAEENHEKALGI